MESAPALARCHEQMSWASHTCACGLTRQTACGRRTTCRTIEVLPLPKLAPASEAVLLPARAGRPAACQGVAPARVGPHDAPLSAHLGSTARLRHMAGRRPETR